MKYFDFLKEPHDFSIRSLSNGATLKWTHPGSALRATFQSRSFISSLESAVKDRKPLHLVPADPNFPAMDSILYDPPGTSTSSQIGPFAPIQVTRNISHPIAISGLQRVQRWLPAKSTLANLRPSKSGMHWPFIYVVPDTLESSFELQDFEGDTPTSEWACKVDQYVVGICEVSIWGRPLKM